MKIKALISIFTTKSSKMDLVLAGVSTFMLVLLLGLIVIISVSIGDVAGFMKDTVKYVIPFVVVCLFFWIKYIVLRNNENRLSRIKEAQYLEEHSKKENSEKRETYIFSCSETLDKERKRLRSILLILGIGGIVCHLLWWLLIYRNLGGTPVAPEGVVVAIAFPMFMFPLVIAVMMQVPRYIELKKSLPKEIEFGKNYISVDINIFYAQNVNYIMMPEFRDEGNESLIYEGYHILKIVHREGTNVYRIPQCEYEKYLKMFETANEWCSNLGVEMRRY